MAARKIIWSRKAVEQLNEILDYYLQHNGNNLYSRRLYKKITDSIKLLSKQDHLGKETDYENIRAIVISHYLLFYESIEKNIEILIIWDGRRNPDELKKLIED